MIEKRLLRDPQTTWVLVLETGDEFTTSLQEFVAGQNLGASHFTDIGAFSRCVLGYFDWQRKDYRCILVDEQVEVVSLIGDVARAEGRPSLHPHAVVAKSDGSAWGGHLLQGHVRPTLELVITETPAELERHFDRETGLALIRR